MTTAIESGVGYLHYGKQPAKGTMATAATTGVGYNRLKHQGGGLDPKKVLGNEEYSDGNRFASPTVFVQSTGGQVGTVTLQAQPENIGLFYAQILGTDTITGAGDPYTHTITPNNAGGAWGTWWQKMGQAIGPMKFVFWDSKIGKLTQNSPRDRNVVHLELDVVALKPGEIFTTDPAKAEDASDPYLLTEATGALTFDGTVISEIEDSMVEVDAKVEPFLGDQVETLQLIEGKGVITRSFDAIVTDDTILKFNKAQYNATAPAGGTRPGSVVFEAACSQVFTRSATRTATVTTPKVEVDPANFEQMGPRPEGGKIPVKFGGICKKSGATPALTVVVLSADASAYA